jgi:hypothetical protein
MVPPDSAHQPKNSRRPWVEAREQVLVEAKDGQTATGGWTMAVRPTPSWQPWRAQHGYTEYCIESLAGPMGCIA